MNRRWPDRVSLLGWVTRQTIHPVSEIMHGVSNSLYIYIYSHKYIHIFVINIVCVYVFGSFKLQHNTILGKLIGCFNHRPLHSISVYMLMTIYENTN